MSIEPEGLGLPMGGEREKRGTRRHSRREGRDKVQASDGVPGS